MAIKDLKTISYKYLVVLLVGTGFASFLASDMYLPAMPALTVALNSSVAVIKLSVTLYVLGMVLSQLVSGPWSDHIGRRPVMLMGIGLMLFGTILAVMAEQQSVFIIARLFQGVGAGVTVSLARIIAGDVTSGRELSRAISYISLFIGLGPAVAPIAGGYLFAWFGWRASFVAILLIYLLLGAGHYLKLPETYSHKPSASPLVTSLKRYKSLLSSSYFMRYAIISACSFGGMLAFLTMSPFLLQDNLGVSAIEFSWLMLTVILGAMLGKVCNIVLSRYYEVDRIIKIAVGIMLFCTIVSLVLAMSEPMTVASVILPMIGFNLSAGMAIPNVFAKAMQVDATIKGSAGALYGSFQVFGGVISTFCIAHVPHGNVIGLALLLVILSVLSVIMLVMPATKALALQSRARM